MIDCHVHLCLDGTVDPFFTLQQEPDPLLTLKSYQFAQLTLQAGITTVRDMGAKNGVITQLRNAVNSGIVTGPRILSSGQCICMTGGHGWLIGREADGPDGVRKAVREQLKTGVDNVKFMATGGILTPGVDPGSAQLTYEEMKAGIEEAHKAGRKTAAHAQGTSGIKNALNAGIDTIEHGIFLDNETIQMMLDRKVAFVPTIAAPFHIIRGLSKGISAAIAEKAKNVSGSHLNSAKKAFSAGVTMAMGTDAGTPFNLHGANAKELELLTEIGFSPMQALVAATGIAAKTLGLENKIGTIEKGKVADLLVVTGNPLNDIKLLQNKENLTIIMKDGIFVKKAI
jgi:imidazolonepropionase-like amidohydrolase